MKLRQTAHTSVRARRVRLLVPSNTKSRESLSLLARPSQTSEQPTAPSYRAHQSFCSPCVEHDRTRRSSIDLAAM